MNRNPRFLLALYIPLAVIAFALGSLETRILVCVMGVGLLLVRWAMPKIPNK